MRTTLLLLTLTLQLTASFAQEIVKGKITDQRGQGLPGANIYIKHTFDGASSDKEGNFLLKTKRTGNDTLVVSFLGYENSEHPIHLRYNGEGLTIRLKEAFNKLEAVTISVGAFEASDEKKYAALKPLDIVTTAGATADISAALNTLPGTQKVGETGRLFVRGGDGSETRTFIDGLWVQNPYYSTLGNTASRGRFSPFLFKGTTFSTGGYSAEYSQALSSTLSLNTIDFPTHNKTDLGLMTVGASAAQTLVGKKQSITTDLGYWNLAPYFAIVKQNRDFDKAPEVFQGSAVYRNKITERGLLKVYGSYSRSIVGIHQLDDVSLSREVPTQLDNSFGYLNASYKDFIGSRWVVTTGVAYNYTKDDYKIDQLNFQKKEQAIHLKNTWKYDLSERADLRVGAESFFTKTTFTTNIENFRRQQLNDELTGAFVESDIYLTNNLTLRPGLRFDYSTLIAEPTFNPRISTAYKTSSYSQVSFAYGQFAQLPSSDLMRYDSKLKYEKADHYILSYQVMKNDRTLRGELYHKKYNNLTTYSGQPNGPLSSLANKGNGYANGFDLFWRDKKTFKNIDYWISYSYLDTRRLYQNFPKEAIPTFASTHNLSIVYKHFISEIRTQLGATVSYGSPRRFNNPNQEEFNEGKTPAYKDLSVNAAYLYKENIIFFASVTNVLGTNNIFGYRYALAADEEGQFRREAINQGAPRFFFVGLFITLSQDKKENQLDTL